MTNDTQTIGILNASGPFWQCHREPRATKRIVVKISPKLQWVLALILPLAREFNLWVQLKTAYKAAGTKDSTVEISCSYMINAHHGAFLSVMLGTAATDLTSWILLGTDFCLNLFLALRIVCMKRKKDIDESKEDKMINDLVCLTNIEKFVKMYFCVLPLISWVV